MSISSDIARNQVTRQEGAMKIRSKDEEDRVSDARLLVSLFMTDLVDDYDLLRKVVVVEV